MRTKPPNAETPAPLLYRWDDIVLSFSASSLLNQHSHGAAELVVSLSQPVRTILGSQQVSARSVLIPPGVDHQNVHADAVSATIYLDVESFCYRALAAQMTPEYSVYTGLPEEGGVRRTLSTVYEKEPDAAECYSLVVEQYLTGSSQRNKVLDRRVAEVVSTLRSNPSISASVKSLAGQVNLSEDRLHHLFTTEMGLPVNRYRIWLRLRLASLRYLNGRTLTSAAHEAGFSDAAHFSRAFSRMFGAAPGKILAERRASKVHFS